MLIWWWILKISVISLLNLCKIFLSGSIRHTIFIFIWLIFGCNLVISTSHVFELANVSPIPKCLYTHSHQPSSLSGDVGHVWLCWDGPRFKRDIFSLNKKINYNDLICYFYFEQKSAVISYSQISCKTQSALRKLPLIQYSW